MDRETVEACMSLSHKRSLAHNSLLVPLSTPPAPHTQLWVGEGDKRWTLITRRFGARQPWGSRHWRLIVVARVAADTQIPHSTTEKSLTPITSGRRHQSGQDNTISSSLLVVFWDHLPFFFPLTLPAECGVQSVNRRRKIVGSVCRKVVARLCRKVVASLCRKTVASLCRKVVAGLWRKIARERDSG